MVTVNQITPIPISSLPAASTITGNEPAAIVQGGQTVQVPINQMPQGIQAGVVVFGSSGGAPFPNYRTLKEGANITFTDNGVQGDLVISSSGGDGGAIINAPVVSEAFDNDYVVLVRNGTIYLITVNNLLNPTPPTSPGGALIFSIANNSGLIAGVL